MDITRLYTSVFTYLCRIQHTSSHINGMLGWFSDKTDGYVIGELILFIKAKKMRKLMVHTTLPQTVIFIMYQILMTRFFACWNRGSNPTQTQQGEGDKCSFWKRCEGPPQIWEIAKTRSSRVNNLPHVDSNLSHWSIRELMTMRCVIQITLMVACSFSKDKSSTENRVKFLTNVTDV